MSSTFSRARLRPRATPTYACTSGCTNLTFNRKHYWVKHEEDVHRVVWECGTCGLTGTYTGVAVHAKRMGHGMDEGRVGRSGEMGRGVGVGGASVSAVPERRDLQRGEEEPRVEADVFGILEFLSWKINPKIDIMPGSSSTIPPMGTLDGGLSDVENNQFSSSSNLSYEFSSESEDDIEEEHDKDMPSSPPWMTHAQLATPPALRPRSIGTRTTRPRTTANSTKAATNLMRRLKDVSSSNNASRQNTPVLRAAPAPPSPNPLAGTQTTAELLAVRSPLLELASGTHRNVTGEKEEGEVAEVIEEDPVQKAVRESLMVIEAFSLGKRVRDEDTGKEGTHAKRVHLGRTVYDTQGRGMDIGFR